MTAPGTAIRQSASKRDPLERYYTPDEHAVAHVRWVQRHCPEVFDLVDPCAGGGAYLRAATACGLQSAGSDLAPACEGVEERDASQGYDRGAPVITNPPFALLPDLLPVWLDGAHTVSLLLPISALERTRSRAVLWDTRPPDRIAHVGRVRFHGPTLGDRSSGAAMAYVWVLWTSRPYEGTRWEWVDLSGGAA